MQKFQLLKGAFGKGVGYIGDGKLVVPKKKGSVETETIKLSKVKSISGDKFKEKLNVKKSLALGAVGGVALGPLGVVGGALLGGKKAEITFSVELKDKRKFTGKGTIDTFNKFKRAAK